MIYVLLTVLAGVCWGCISLFLRPLSQIGFTSLQVMFCRALFSSVFLFIFLMIKDRNLLKIKFRDIWMFLGTGVISLTFFSLCYFKTILEVGTSIAVVLLYTSPVFVLIFSLILFRERMTLKKTIAIIFTVLGCVLVVGIFSEQGDGSPGVSGVTSNQGDGSHLISPKGILIGLCAGLGYALYSVFSRFALKKYNSLTVTFYTFVFSGISLLPFIHLKTCVELVNFNSLILLIGIAFFCTALPYIFYTVGLSGLETSKAAILVTIEPLVGTLIGFFVWKEKFDLPIIIGIILIFSAVIILSIPEKSTNKEK